MKKPLFWTLALCTIFSPYISQAGDHQSKTQFGFIENKGQVVNQDNKPNAAVGYLLNTAGLNVQLRADGFSYDAFVAERNNTSVAYKFHRVDIALIGADANCKKITSEAAPDYINYYTNGNEVLNVHHYNTVTYKNIYPGIDLEFIAGNGVEYNFIVHPGADPSQIRLRYEGMNDISLVNNRLNLSVAHGKINERIPESYIAGNHHPVAVSYNETGSNTFGFTVGAYDKTQTLIIDPKPDIPWATYYGGAGADTSSSLAVSGTSVYMTGMTLSATNIATNGAHQTTKNSGSDMFLTKFDAAGARQWGTYYGDAGDEAGYCVAADGNGNTAVTGVTNSSSGITTTNAHQTTIGGTTDAFIATFNTSGQRQWCTYYGGNAFDAGYGITYSGTNIFITGTTGSPDMGVIATSSAAEHQTIMAGTQDAFLVKFSSTGSRLWGTYYGDINSDQGYSVATDNSGNAFIAGIVNDGISGSLASSTTHQSTYGGGTTDYFLGKFDGSDGSRLWGTYYGGSADESDQPGKKLAVDANGNVYMAGATNSESNNQEIATTGAFQVSLSNNSRDGFIVKFNGSGVRQWATYYGTMDNESLTGIIAGASGDIFAVGTTTSNTGLQTSDAIQKASGGGTDLFVTSFNSTGTRQWTTYFGGNQNETGFSIAADAGEHVFISGSTSSSTGLATSTAHQGTFGSGGADAFLARLNACKTNNISATSAITGAGCFGESNGVISVNATGGTAPYQYKLGTNAFQTSNSFNNLGAGNYDITIKDDNSCEFTKQETVTSFPEIPSFSITGSNTVLAFFDQNYNVQFSATPPSGLTYKWKVVSGNGVVKGPDTNGTADVTWGHPGTGILRLIVTSGTCPDSLDYTVTIGPSSVNNITAGGMEIYPNPANSQVTIKLNAAPAGNEQLKLYDNLGRIVLAQELKKEQTVNISRLPQGVYYLQIGNMQKKITKL